MGRVQTHNSVSRGLGDLVPIPAQPHPSFEGTSLSLGFVIWEMELMIYPPCKTILKMYTACP